LLSAWRVMLEQDLARVPTSAQPGPGHRLRPRKAHEKAGQSHGEIAEELPS